MKKGLLIFLVVALSALLITLLEEKTGFKHTQKLAVVIALACTGIWFYQPAKKEEP
ncbi:MAG: hypothetical protein U0U70_11445 [Chitinophagaceae bacterium]